MNHRHIAPAVALALAFVTSLGCAFGEWRPDDPLDRKLALEDAYKDYSANVRWSKFREASKYVDPELRDEFIANAPKFKNFRFTDWEAEPFDLDEEKRNATIEVTYYGYRTDTLVEKPITERQEWYREGGGPASHWFVRPRFDSPELGLAAAADR